MTAAILEVHPVSKLLVTALASVATDPDQVSQPDPYLDELISFQTVAEETPRRRAGRKLALPTLYRWSSPRGCRGIVLRTTQLGCCRMTTRRWLLEFFEALAAQCRGEPNAVPTRPPALPVSRTPAARRRAIAEADRALAEMGVRHCRTDNRRPGPCE
jgi:hypothetical protein